ncbi:MAG: hypothetical protein VST66_10890, partial [Nitrospirota bacterium]|nr:hypothetical protein [Nitrospirota bacterium]
LNFNTFQLWVLLKATIEMGKRVDLFKHYTSIPSLTCHVPIPPQFVHECLGAVQEVNRRKADPGPSRFESTARTRQ